MYKIAAFYHFVPLECLSTLRADLREQCIAHGICGTLLIAQEGINGTLAGAEPDIAAMLDLLAQRTGLPLDNVKFSFAGEKPFKRLKVKLKREIITFKQPCADPNAHKTGAYVTDGNDQRYATIGQIAEAEGLDWGGHWTPAIDGCQPDYDHIQMRGWKTT